VQFRVPTQLERTGDFSQSRDNNGNLLNALYDASTGLPKSQCVQGGATAACFQDGGVLGKIPASRLYPLGLNVLNIWPIQSNVTQVAGRSYNYETTTPIVDSPRRSPPSGWTIRPRRNCGSAARASSGGQLQGRPGSIPGVQRHAEPGSVIYAWASTATYGSSNDVLLRALSSRRISSERPPVTPFNKNNLGLIDPDALSGLRQVRSFVYEVSILN
jgi:hypothetical protein